MAQVNKICLIGFPRSRSSFLLESLSRHYDLHTEKSIEDLFHSFRHYNIDENEFVKRYAELLNELDDPNKRFIIRFHPVHLSKRRSKHVDFDLNLILDFDQYNFSQYDKIYFSTRNLVDQICSLFVAAKTGIWTYKKDNGTRPLSKLEGWIIEENAGMIFNALGDQIIVDQLEQYLKRNNISYEVLDYDNIVTYAEKNGLPVKEISHLETHYDYSKIILNYDQLPQYVEVSRKSMSYFNQAIRLPS